MLGLADARPPLSPSRVLCAPDRVLPLLLLL